MPSKAVRRAQLEAEGDRAGVEFRLGQCTGRWEVRHARARVVWGWIFILAVACGGFLLPSKPIVGGILVLGVAMAAVPPRTRRDRLFRYDGGIVAQAAREPEPVIMRWADLASMTVTIGSGYEGEYISRCELRDREGNTLVVPSAFDAGCAQVATAADRVLAAQLVPGLLARLDAGQPVTVGRVTVDARGLSYSPPAKATSGYGSRSSRVEWHEASGVHIQMHGHRVSVARSGKGATDIRMDGQVNEFTVRYVIEHAARRAGVAVTGDTAPWEGESAVAAMLPTITAPTLPAPWEPPHQAEAVDDRDH